jgi:hypothetical protein
MDMGDKMERRDLLNAVGFEETISLGRHHLRGFLALGVALAMTAGCALRMGKGTIYAVEQTDSADRLTVLVQVGSSPDERLSTHKGLVRKSVYDGPYGLAIDVRDPTFTCTRFRIEDACVSSLDGKNKLVLTYVTGMTGNGGKRRYADGWIPMEHDRKHWVVRGIGGKAARNYVTADEGAVDLDSIGEKVVFSFTIVSEWGEETRTARVRAILLRKRDSYITWEPLFLV